jgi:hypothetical protein
MHQLQLHLAAAAGLPADVAEQRASICSKGSRQAGSACWCPPVVAEAARGTEQAGCAEGGRSVLARGTHLQDSEQHMHCAENGGTKATARTPTTGTRDRR